MEQQPQPPFKAQENKICTALGVKTKEFFQQSWPAEFCFQWVLVC